MIFKILQYIRGYLRIRVTGYSAERFLNACRHRGIRLWNLRPVHNTNAYEMNISIRGFRKIKPVVRKTGVRIVITDREGLPFFLYRYRRRRLFFVGASLFFLLIYTLSGFVWSIDIRGNLTRTDETLLEFLNTTDVRNGMRLSEVDCGRIVKDIRKEYNDIIWVSASLEGTKLIIQIKENQDVIRASENETEPGTEIQPTDIVSDMDCVITSIITRKGIPQVEEGAEIKSGDILVSGQIPVSNDAGEIVSYRYQEADADILGQTVISYKDEQELTYEDKEIVTYDLKGEETVEKHEYYLRFGTFRICLGDVKNNYEHFEQYGKETRLRLFDNFYLPVSYGEKWAVPYEVTERKYEKKELQSILSRRFSEYCEDLRKKGVEIIGNDVKIYTGSKKAEAKGTLEVVMPVGKEKPSQLTDITAPAEENEQSGENVNGDSGNSD